MGTFHKGQSTKAARSILTRAIEMALAYEHDAESRQLVADAQAYYLRLRDRAVSL